MTSQVRAVRKQVVKKALGLMERIDNVKAGMLRSLLDITHPHAQLESRPSLLESRMSQLETKSSQLDSALGQPNKAGPAAPDAPLHSSAGDLTPEQQHSKDAPPGFDASSGRHQHDISPCDAAAADIHTSTPAASAAAATPGAQGITDVHLGSSASISEQPGSGPSTSEEQPGDVAQQVVNASGSHQNHDAVADAEKADVYSVAAAFAGAATPAQTDSEHKQLQDKEGEVDEEVTRQIFSALQQQGGSDMSPS